MIEVDRDRNVIPRWRKAAAVVSARENASVRPTPKQLWLDDVSELEAKRAAWEQQKLPFQAVELVAAALLYRNPASGQEAAHFLLESKSEAFRGLARRLLESGDSDRTQDDLYELTSQTISRQAIHLTIRQLREGLRREPRNPFGWTDLARAHASTGNKEASDRAMRIALALNPQHRIILRSASRLYIHNGERSRAHSILQRADDVRADPWLLAAELGTASAANRKSRFTRVANRLMRDESIEPLHKTELASALGTLHFRDGNTRQARKLFQFSLTDPTDNSVAQAQWVASRGLDMLRELHERVTIRRGFEARARRALTIGEWDEMAAECRLWLYDEPFAVDPAAFGSFGTSVGAMNFTEGIAFARAGLSANPSDQLLRNNLVFSLVHAGQLADAERAFCKIGKPKENMRIPLLATEGLLQYRRDNPSEGRRLYLTAIEEARSKPLVWRQANRQVILLASLFFAYEELLVGTRPQESRPVQKALERLRQQPLPELALWLDQIESRHRGLVADRISVGIDRCE